MGANLEEAKHYEARQRLIEQNRQLDQAVKVGYDMENIAIGSKVELQRQSEQMNKVQGKVYGIDEELGQSNKIMDDIARRRKVNRLIVYGVFTVVGLALLVILYTHFS
mmetsp:Transcript_27004/g.20210  ORF Transcript_27004/g.20210 Transcript_27004/m.20210 type:complete len:108 (+) Transcript_27004:311-634(+)